ncbi:cobalamin-binding protein [Streptomyces carminius]|uniref:Cobalamin-binding protein n=1 Tax=Streptomyces carminius TaxID=2665496 RepID=A0A2M8LTI0_9ACTN|nr:cobalamin-dependent protein [Streptomyces carminius]PJE95263.1 cobalamin-binding protein [Streptomyces carminius]
MTPPTVPAAELGELAEKFWTALENADEHAAVGLAVGAVEEGVPPEDVLLDVVAAAQRRVGARWADNLLTVAQEHAATAISGRAVAAVAALPAARTAVPRLGHTVVTCTDGEWHALPARLVAEVLRLRGWQVDFLGAHVPVRHLVAHLHSTGPDAVALSCSLPVRLPVAHATVTACQAAGVPVLAGGAGFGPDGRWARTLGADVWAPDARSAAERLAAGLPSPRVADPADRERPVPPDHEHAQVGRARSQLVAEVLRELPERFPGMRDYTEQQRERTAEDLAHVLDFLAAALYVDDPGLFEDFLAWTARILAARGVPAHSLAAGLDVLAGKLDGLPRAAAFTVAGQAVLVRPDTSRPAGSGPPGRPGPLPL